MVDLYLTGLVVALFLGALGGGLYALINNLFSSKDTYFSALEHVVVGAVVGLVLVILFGYPATYPPTAASALPFVAAGYAGLDVLQLIAAKLEGAVPTTPAA